MHRLRSTKILGFLLVVICTIPIFTNAEDLLMERGLPINNAEIASFDCDEYSKTGRLEAAFVVSNERIKAGDVVNFKGEIKNTNSFPIASASVFVKIAKKQLNGDIDIVDQFYVEKGLSIPAKSEITASVPIEFEWKSPLSLTSGEYVVLSYVFVGDSFNMNGFDFSDDIATNSNTFYVESGMNSRSPYFDKNTLSVNNYKYTQLGFAREIGEEDTVLISSSVINESDVPTDVIIKWTVYNGHFINDKNILESKTEKIRLIAGERQLISYIPTLVLGKNSIVVGEARSYDSKSYVNISINKISEKFGNIKLSGLSNIDTNNSTTTVFACYTAGGLLDDNLFFYITLSDKNGNVLFTDKSKVVLLDSLSTYSKIIPSIGGYNNLLLVAELKDGEDVLDSASLKYSCNTDEKGCIKSKSKNEKSEVVTSSKALSLIIVTLLTFLIIMLYFINHKRSVNHIYNKKDEEVSI